MEGCELKAWRTKLGLTQKAAANELGLATLTIQKYERGFRNDTGQPVIIPEKIALACEELSRRFHQKEATTHLKWRQVSDDVIDRIADKMRHAGIGIVPHPVTCFRYENYKPFSQEIDNWLESNVSNGYARVSVPDENVNGESIVVLHFFDRNDAMFFALTFGGRSLEP